MVMFWKRCDLRSRYLVLGLLGFVLFGRLSAQTPPPLALTETKPNPIPIQFLHAIDVDNHNFIINQKKRITLVFYTTEDSQDEVKAAGRALYAFQGRKDFQLVVIVDLRDSMAGWAKDITIGLTRRNLDDEAHNLRPYFLANHNTANPRDTMHVVDDFDGSTCQILGWGQAQPRLRVLIYDHTGREVNRFDPPVDVKLMVKSIQAALDAYAAAKNKKVPTTAPTPEEDISH